LLQLCHGEKTSAVGEWLEGGLTPLPPARGRGDWTRGIDYLEGIEIIDVIDDIEVIEGIDVIERIGVNERIEGIENNRRERIGV